MSKCLIFFLATITVNLFAKVSHYNPKLQSDKYFLKKTYSKESLIKFSEIWAKEFFLKEHIVKAIIEQESTWNHSAISKVKAKGLMQIMRGTAAHLKMSPRESLYNPYTNIYYGCKYLKQLLDRYNGDYFYALVGYYAGPKNSDKLMMNKIRSNSYRKKITNYAYSVLKKSLRYMEVSINEEKQRKISRRSISSYSSG